MPVKMFTKRNIKPTIVCPCSMIIFIQFLCFFKPWFCLSNLSLLRHSICYVSSTGNFWNEWLHKMEKKWKTENLSSIDVLIIEDNIFVLLFHVSSARDRQPTISICSFEPLRVSSNLQDKGSTFFPKLFQDPKNSSISTVEPVTSHSTPPPALPTSQNPVN